MRRALVCAVLFVAACRARIPTYHHDVAPLIEQHCRECHRPDGVAAVPPLDSYANAKMYAQPMRFAVQARRMPPWGADNTGLCGSWVGARWLTTDEIATIAAWQQNGAPEGKAESPVVKPAVEAPFRSDATLDLGVYRPGLGAGGYRCFVADPALARDRLLSAIRVVATDPRGLAQVTLFALDSSAGEADARALDDADPAPGYSCYGTARARDARLVASWTWPTPIARMPAGTGVRLAAARKLIVQLHYDITLPGGDYRSGARIELEFDDAAKEARVLPVVATGTLPEEKRYVAVENRVTIERRLNVVGIAPRMHIRGLALNLTVERGGQSTCLADFDHWHFYDQQLFRAAHSIALQQKDRLHIACSYATLGRDKPIVFGDGIDDEECVAYLFVTEPD